jgi:hypothetical protein
MLAKSAVKIVARPGYFGKRRPEILAELAAKFPGCMECWQVGDLILTFDEAVMLYDDAYFQHLSQKPDLLEWVTSFGECYDSARDNIACGINHDPHASPRHIQDVSVRRALVRLGVYFKQYLGYCESAYTDDQLLHIRGDSTNGFILMPGNVSFHRPDLISTEPIDKIQSWIKPGSIEFFWQMNKVIVLGANDVTSGKA